MSNSVASNEGGRGGPDRPSTLCLSPVLRRDEDRPDTVADVLSRRRKRRKRRAAMLSKQHTDALTLSMKSEIRSSEFWKALRCEFLATMLYVFIGCGAAQSSSVNDLIAKHSIAENGRLPVDNHSPKYIISLGDLQEAIAFGGAAALLTRSMGHLSGGHFNPAITLAKLVTRNVTVLRAVAYIIVQCLGGIAGSVILFGITPAELRTNLGATFIHPDIGLGQAFGVEFMTSFILVISVFGQTNHDTLSQAFNVGLAICVGNLVALPLTGAGMNPARSLGPALLSNTWKDHWVYWIGPLLGGILAGFTCEYTHGHFQTKKPSPGTAPSSRHAANTLPAAPVLASGLRRVESDNSMDSSVSVEMTLSVSDDLRV